MEIFDKYSKKKKENSKLFFNVMFSKINQGPKIFCVFFMFGLLFIDSLKLWQQQNIISVTFDFI